MIYTVIFTWSFTSTINVDYPSSWQCSPSTVV